MWPRALSDSPRRAPRGRRPFRGVDLLDVVHEVEAERLGRARVKRGEDAGLPVAGDFRDLLETGIAQHPHRQLAAFVHAPVFGGDGRLADPFLQPLHRFVVAAFDLREDRGELGLLGSNQERHGQSRRGGSCVFEKGSAIDAHGFPPPPRPSLQQYRKLAKDLVKACDSAAAAIAAWADRWMAGLLAGRRVPAAAPATASGADSRAIGAGASHVAVVRLLLERGARPGMRSRYGDIVEATIWRAAH